jgi:hypothetical protein
MKSEHRHELKTNELERIASDWGHASERYVHQHTNQLVVAAIVVVVLLVAFIYWRMSAGALDSQGWRAFADAQSTADYGTVADKYAGTKVAAWARLREGELELSSGIHLLFTNRDAGRSDLNKAAEDFQKLIDDKSSPDEVVDRALFGLARCRESLPEKNTGPSTINNAAIETYERLLKRDTPYKELAEARVAALRTGTAQDFNAWFETQSPKPADRAMPKDLSIPPLPEDFGPSGKPAAKADTPAPAAGGKPEDAFKDLPSLTPAPSKAPSTNGGAGKSNSAAPAKSNDKPAQSGPAMPNPAAPASK